MPRRATKIVEGMRAWVRAVEKRRREERMWEAAHERDRVSQGMASLDVGCGEGGEAGGRKGLRSFSPLGKSGEDGSSSLCGVPVGGEIVEVGDRGSDEETKRGRRRFVRRAVVAKRTMQKDPYRTENCWRVMGD